MTPLLTTPLLTTPLLLGAVVIVVLLMVGWWLSSLARRLDRVHRRAERTWVVLDAALRHRARLARAVADDVQLDEPTRSQLRDAAEAALSAGLSTGSGNETSGFGTREYAESALSRVLSLAVPSTTAESLLEAQHRVTVARRLHSDAVTTARALRRRRTVRLFRLAGHAAALIPFEMVDYPDPEVSGPLGTPSEGAVSAVLGRGLTTTLGPWNRSVG